jgi:iron-sulfur cluster repair protein YtfE (RIC family)
MDVLDVLHKDHEKVSRLFAEANRSGADAKSLFEQIRTEFEVHARAEEGIFYPAIERIGSEAADAVATAIAQHGDAINLIAQIAKSASKNGDLHSGLKQLQTVIESHVKHEETVMFPLARKHLIAELSKIGEMVKNREEALKAGGQIAGSE